MTLTVNGYSKSATYAAAGSPANFASNLASAFNNDPNSPVAASASGGTIYFTTRAAGSATGYSFSGSSVENNTTWFLCCSFSFSPTGGNLTAGQDAYTTYDSGTVTATVGGVPMSTTYQQGSTPTSIASSLASSINGNGSSPVTASASGSTVNLTAKLTGSNTNYSLSSTVSSSVSFNATASGAALTGGTDATASGLTTPAITTYTYDLNNNLTGVTAAMGPQSRSYQYDLLSRVTQKTDPETGTTNFSYTTSTGGLCSGDPGAVCRRTDARNITTTYGYDSLNRLTSKTYSDSTAAVSYFYDQTSYNGLTIANGKGRRTGMSDGSGQTAWSFNPLGNITTEQRTINGATKTISYTYDFDGSISSITYPSGRTVTYTVGNAQRPTAATDTTNGINYAICSKWRSGQYRLWLCRWRRNYGNADLQQPSPTDGDSGRCSGHAQHCVEFSVQLRSE